MDLDGDNQNELIVAANNFELYVWDEAGSYDAANIPWGGFGGDSSHASFVQTDTPIQPLPDVVFTIYVPLVTR